jgi:hypothetical protein
VREWEELDQEIPLTKGGGEKGSMLLKDLPIMWRPGKSPGMVQEGFRSTEALRPSGSEDGSVRKKGGGICLEDLDGST